ncbi:MAG: pyridoxal-phosphate dependent enzyme [Conexivisphaerales archaeon]
MNLQNTNDTVDYELLSKFENEIESKAPHWEDGKVVNPTPLIDLSNLLEEYASSKGIKLQAIKVMGKMESEIISGSVKMRPALWIIGEAIRSGKLKRGMTIIEATSGNFGIALGILRKLGLNVVVLVSRKLQEGVVERLKDQGIGIIDLDVDICPAPGADSSKLDSLIVRTAADRLREELANLGFSIHTFDKSRGRIEELLATQNIIELAAYLANIYGCFCPRQYDNELNIKVHEELTAPEIAQQLKDAGYDIESFKIITTFGTGGTSGGISRWIKENTGKSSVHVVFPLPGQDVAGIRTKDKALGLRFYDPSMYASQIEVDFEKSRQLMSFFAEKGYSIGESGALALQGVLELASKGVGDKFIVIIADGIEKYNKNISYEKYPVEIELEEAIKLPVDDIALIWSHHNFIPNEEGIELLCKTFSYNKEIIGTTPDMTKEVSDLIFSNILDSKLDSVIRENKSKTLILVCIAGGVSLRVAEKLREKGIKARSLKGGIMKIALQRGNDIFSLVQKVN